MYTDFVLEGKWTIFWLKRGLRVYLDLYVPDCPKRTSKYFYSLVLFSQKPPYFEGFLLKNPPNPCEQILAKQMENLSKIHLKYEFGKI